MTNLTQFDPHVYPRTPRGLLFLLHYAHRHHHSRFWIPALLTLLAREEVARG